MKQLMSLLLMIFTLAAFQPVATATNGNIAKSEGVSHELKITNSGEISGKVTDAETQETLPFANVALKRNGIMLHGVATDLDGFYTFNGLPPGTYDLEVSYVGYQVFKQTDIPVAIDQLVTVNVTMTSEMLDVVIIPAYREPLLIPGKSPSSYNFGRKDMQNMAVKKPLDIISNSAGIFQGDQGEGISVRGARVGSTLYIVDGVKVDNINGIPSNGISQMEVITGGIPAKYGDATGGVIVITTRSYLDNH